MDKIHINLTTNFMRKAAAKIIAKSIYKKCGYEFDIQFNELEIDMIDGETRISTNVDLSLKSDEFKRILKDIK